MESPATSGRRTSRRAERVISDLRLHMTLSDDLQRPRRNAGLFKIRLNIRKMGLLTARIRCLAQRLNTSKQETRFFLRELYCNHYRKGGYHALDYICDSTNFVGAGTVDRLYDGRRHSRAAGGRHRCNPDPGDSGTKTGVTRRILAGRRAVKKRGWYGKY